MKPKQFLTKQRSVKSFHLLNSAQRMETEKEGRGDEPRSSLPDSAPSAYRTDDSRRVLDSSPNRRGARLPWRFRRNLRWKQALAASWPLLHEPPRRLGSVGSATYGLRTSIKNTSKLAATRKKCQVKDPQVHTPKSRNEDSAASSGA